MTISSSVAIVAGALIGLRWLVQFILGRLNQGSVRAHADSVPPAFREVIDAPTYARSVEYTLAKARFAEIEISFEAALLAVVLFSGVLPWYFARFIGWLGESAWAMAAFLLSTGILLSLPGLPLSLYEQFRLEERFGFNTTRLGTWVADRLKGLLLTVILGGPLLTLILKLVEWTGSYWWLWAWVALLVFQLVMTLLAPVVIMPLFNKFTPLPGGSLRDRLLELGHRTGFRAGDIQVMDGSKRSRHSNAFFTGFGRFRKIVLFDTLIQQLSEPELEAVLAHEIGHYKKRHIPKMLAWSTLTSLLGLAVIAWLAGQAWFYQAFGFPPGQLATALLLFSLLSGLALFWFSPIAHWWSRRHEYEADAYAAAIMREPASLVGALRKLNEKNLSNLTPHPFYSGFYYSHPTLLEREQALHTQQLQTA